REVSDLLDVQDQLVDAVVRALALQVRSAELKRVRTIRPEHRGAYQFLLQGQECMHAPSRPSFEAAEALCREAIERGPNCAPPYYWLAYWHVMRVGQEWSSSQDQDAAQAEHFAELASECDPADPMAIAVQGHIAAYLHKDFDRAFSFFERALEIN